MNCEARVNNDLRREIEVWEKWEGDDKQTYYTLSEEQLKKHDRELVEGIIEEMKALYKGKLKLFPKKGYGLQSDGPDYFYDNAINDSIDRIREKYLKLWKISP